jgi:hypothetical protein
MMPGGADNTRRLTDAQVCEIAGTSQQRRQGWVKRRWLRKAPQGGCGLRDALELTQLKALIDVLGPTDGPVAWLQVRTDLEQPFPAEQLDVVFDVQFKRAVVARADTDLRQVIAHGRPVRVVALAGLRDQTAGAFRRLAEVSGASAKSQTTRPAKRGHRTA